MDEQTYQQQSVYQQQPNWMPINNQEEPKQWLDITSFVLSLLGFNILWLIFWIIALNKKQLRRAAMAGTIISAVKLVLSIFLLMWIFAGAIIPRLWVAQQMARDIARESDLIQLQEVVIKYEKNEWRYPFVWNGCISPSELQDKLIWIEYLNNIPEDPSRLPWLFCDEFTYWYWTDWNHLALISASENWKSANLCDEYVIEFKNALEQNDVDTAKLVLNNVWNSCNESGATNLFYVLLN